MPVPLAVVISAGSDTEEYLTLRGSAITETLKDSHCTSYVH
jgi:hypothetical protein